VSVTYEAPLADWYNGACTITQDGEVVTGSTPLESGTLVLDNGLVQVSYDTGAADGLYKAFVVAKAGSTSWGTDYLVGLTDNPGGSIFDLSAPSVLTNSPDVCALRYNMAGGSVDVSITRGSFVVTVAVNLVDAAKIMLAPGRNDTNFPVDMAFFAAVAPEAPSAIGWTSATAHIVAPGTPSQGCVAYGSGALGSNEIAGTYTAPTVARRTHVFAYLPVFSVASKTGDDELYGMTRQFFSMIAQQTSAGVL